jgi:hypothetical protein
MSKKLYKYKEDSERHYDFSGHSRSYNLPATALAWLRRYRISDLDIVQHGFFWDSDKDSLVMPVLSGDRIVLTASRYFGSNASHPKYVTRGYKTGHFKLIKPKESSDIYVIVEDYLSAIRVGRYANAIPLFGMHCPRELLFSLLPLHPTLRFWLDRNMANEAAKQAARARQWIPNCATIVTDLDPKEYDDNQIKRIIDESVLQRT